MEILVFKTNIRHRKHIREVAPFITNYPGIIQWNVDLHDADKILRIKTHEIHPATIEQLVKKAGYHCEELKD